MELVTQTAKGRVYRTDSGQEAVNFASMYKGTYFFNHSSDRWSVIINGSTGKTLSLLQRASKFGK